MHILTILYTMGGWGGGFRSRHSIHKAKEVNPRGKKGSGSRHKGSRYTSWKMLILQATGWPCDFAHHYNHGFDLALVYYPTMLCWFGQSCVDYG